MDWVFQNNADFLLWGGSAFLHYLKIMNQWFQSMYDRQKPLFYAFHCSMNNIETGGFEDENY